MLESAQLQESRGGMPKRTEHLTRRAEFSTPETRAVAASLEAAAGPKRRGASALVAASVAMLAALPTAAILFPLIATPAVPAVVVVVVEAGLVPRAALPRARLGQMVRPLSAEAAARNVVDHAAKGRFSWKF